MTPAGDTLNKVWQDMQAPLSPEEKAAVAAARQEAKEAKAAELGHELIRLQAQPPARPLGEILDEVAQLEAILLETPGEEALAAIDEWLQKLGVEREQKLDAYCAVIEENQRLASLRKGAADRLLQLARTNQGVADRLKERLYHYFKAYGYKRVDTNRYQVAIQANGGPLPLEVLDEKLVPDDYKITITTTQLDNKAIRAALTAGEVIEGVQYGERGDHLRIK